MRIVISVSFGDGRNPSSSPARTINTPGRAGEVKFCDRVQDPELPSPLTGEGWDGGDEGFIVHPHLDPPPSPKGEEI